MIAGEFPPSEGTIELFGRDVTILPARRRPGIGLTRTYQTSRLFLGLSVEDNLYLAVLGVKRGHLRPLRLPRDAELRDTARSIAARIGLEEQLPSTVRDLSHGEQRQLEVGMALAGEPKLMMLDEPAAGLSRAERVNLGDCPRSPETHALLIEHDMDVALRVAEYVTMMHDGRVIVEGTPDEIRANQLVHDLYLGRPMASSEPVLAVKGLRVLRAVTRSPGRRVRGRDRARVDHRAERHGEEHALQGDHGHLPADRTRVRPLSRYRACGEGLVQGVVRRRRLRTSGASTVPVALSRRAFADGEGHERREVERQGDLRAFSRAWWTARRSAARNSRAASSRCSRSAARCSRTRRC